MIVAERAQYAWMARRQGPQLGRRWPEYVDPCGPWTYRGPVVVLVEHFSVQGNHLHLIVEGVDKPSLRSATTGLNVRIARGLNRAMNSFGRCIGDRYHTHILRTPAEVRNAVRYVVTNHEHHTGDTAPDKFSSALNPTLVLAPQTWLLRKAFDPPL